jgi:hypothetical protein
MAKHWGKPTIGASDMTEEWRPVYGFEDYFLISNLGTVKTLNPSARVKTLAHWATDRGYSMVTLWANGERKHRSVHSLLLEAFVCPRPPGNVARHRDGDQSNNALENLEWGTYRQNHFDKKRHGTFQEGERHGMSKLTDAIVRYIRTSGKSIGELAKEYGVSEQAIYHARTGKTWAHVDCPPVLDSVYVRRRSCNANRRQAGQV